ncbi:VanZ family protein [Terrilactibacillus sp. BCM23-1]|uniref:VanZ family protein n=1 Tax=Terrilactibacillus tamarindi TaxID=2599694 RepID=A0A6N8CR25_9BACI|nr:VanZ family protein [Terrilactibacillus tamarindi]MTT32130.1 VanZ family protein [Terrilactibacillus tamarindi]
MIHIIKERWMRFIELLFDTYIAILLYVTLFTFNHYTYGKSVNLVLFNSIHFMFDTGNVVLILKNVVGNIGLFVPFGFMVPFLYHKLRPLYMCLFLSSFFSSSIEICQYLFAERIFDVDDIALNTIGAGMGWFLYYSSVKLYDLVFKSKIDTQ